MVEAFIFEKHGEVLKNWLQRHELGVELLEDLPELGFISSDAAGYVAAGFIRQIENSDMVLLDGLIANPESFGKRRYLALDEVVLRIVQQCKEMQVPKILAFSTDTATLKRSKRHGFEAVPQVLIGLDII